MTWIPWRLAGRVEETWDLGRDQTSHVPGTRRPLAIRVERGLVLVTREGDPEDHVLHAGDALVVPPRGKVVAWALEPTRATVREAPAGASRQVSSQRSPGARRGDGDQRLKRRRGDLAGTGSWT
ncbi:MAG TPA: DUF2917 domain-containing protein [Anaeromyxobacteraceae bacterium]|nr:DUF2917 domain-containing protein [Anaeromyxobacteraceae bacterium]